jgi:uncharacterized protein YjaG (DUF416 family)
MKRLSFDYPLHSYSNKRFARVSSYSFLTFKTERFITQYDSKCKQLRNQKHYSKIKNLIWTGLEKGGLVELFINSLKREENHHGA